MINKLKITIYGLFILCIYGCAALHPGFDTPVVTINSFEAIPAQGLVPQFQIGLHIVNPNRSALNLKGISYTIALEGHKVITGVSNQLPEIEAYGEGDIILNASIDIFNSIGFFSDLIRNQTKEELSYSLEAKLDAGGLYKLIRVTRKGTILLPQSI